MKSERNIVDIEQPKPVHNDLPACWDLVIDQMRQRDQIGRQRYGTPLQPFNGRNALRDFSEELMDAIVYCEQFQEELKWIGLALLAVQTQLIEASQNTGVDLSQAMETVASIIRRNPVFQKGA